MTATTLPPLTTTDARATPYQRGFEDARYNRIYANPYRLGSIAWRAYDAGCADARREGRGKA